MLSVKNGLGKLVNFVAGEYQPDKIILFGSYGTPSAGKNSDIDLLIIKRVNKRFVDRSVEVMRLVRSRFGFEYPVEPFVYTPEEFEEAKKTNSAFIRTILAKGRVLYAKE